MRLRGHDYSGPGSYFVTICTKDRRCLFGSIRDGVMQLSTPGLVVESWWLSIPREYPDVFLDSLVVMPNHIHGIISLGTEPEQFLHGSGQALSDVIGWFKSRTTHDYIRGVRTDSWPGFRDKLWQQGYYEHIIRTTKALDRIRTYIEANPSQWERDDYYID